MASDKFSLMRLRKSIDQLSELQSYRVVDSTSLRDVIGRQYNPAIMHSTSQSLFSQPLNLFDDYSAVSLSFPQTERETDQETLESTQPMVIDLDSCSISGSPLLSSTETPDIELVASGESVYVEQVQTAKEIYADLLQILIKRINSFSASKDKRDKEFKPFISNVKQYKGYICFPLIHADAKKFKSIIQDYVNEVWICEPAREVLQIEIEKFMNEFKVFCYEEYEQTTRDQASNELVTTAVPFDMSFSLDVATEADEDALRIFSYSIWTTSNLNRGVASNYMSPQRSVNQTLLTTLLYRQLDYKLNYSEEIKETEQILAVLHMPTGFNRATRGIDSNLNRSDIIIRFVVAKFDPVVGYESFYEISKLKKSSAEIKRIDELLCTDKTSNKFNEIIHRILVQNKRSSGEAEKLDQYYILTESELKIFLQELVKNNRSPEFTKIIPVVAAEPRRNRKRSSDNQEFPQQRKAGSKSVTVATGLVSNSLWKPAASATSSAQDEVADIVETQQERQKLIRLDAIDNLITDAGASTSSDSDSDSDSDVDYFVKLASKTIRKVSSVYAQVGNIILDDTGFPFEKWRSKLVFRDTSLNQVLLQQIATEIGLFPYQVDGVAKIIQGINTNIGMGLFDDMGLGKTIQVGAVLKYMLAANRINKPILIIVPTNNVLKWQNELVYKCKIPKNCIFTYKKTIKHSKDFLTRRKIIITTPSLYQANMTCASDTALRKVLPIINLSDLTDLDAKTHADWEGFKKNNFKKDSELLHMFIFTKENSQGMRHIPTNLQFAQISTRSRISEPHLRKLFAAEMTLSFLKENNFVKNGVVVKKMQRNNRAVKNLIIKYKLNITPEFVINAVNKAYTGFGLSGLIIDEAHQFSPQGRKFPAILPISTRLAEKNSLRIMITGTPFRNNIYELWGVNQLLNPEKMSSKLEFKKRFQNVLKISVQTLRSCLALKDQESVDNFDFESAAYSLNYTLRQFKSLANEFSRRNIRRTKQDQAILDFFEKNKSDNKLNIPCRQGHNVEWSLSPLQDQIFATMNQEKINSVFKGCSVLSDRESMPRVKMTDSGERERSDSGLALLNNVAKLFDHPILFDSVHGKHLFASGKNFLEKYCYLEQQFSDNLESLIRASGKFTAALATLREILLNPESKVLITTTLIPMAAIFKLIITKYMPDVNCEVYHGNLSMDARKRIQDDFNGNASNCRVVILSQKSGGEAIDLYASDIIAYDQSWTDSAKEQLYARAIRVGSPYATVKVHEFIGKNVLDQKMQSFIDEKMSWSQLFVEHDVENCEQFWFLERIKQYLALFANKQSSQVADSNPFADDILLRLYTAMTTNSAVASTSMQVDVASSESEASATTSFNPDGEFPDEFSQSFPYSTLQVSDPDDEEETGMLEPQEIISVLSQQDTLPNLYSTEFFKHGRKRYIDTGQQEAAESRKRTKFDDNYSASSSFDC